MQYFIIGGLRSLDDRCSIVFKPRSARFEQPPLRLRFLILLIQECESPPGKYDITNNVNSIPDFYRLPAVSQIVWQIKFTPARPPRILFAFKLGLVRAYSAMEFRNKLC
jgi:hypothetical protein